MAAEQQVSRAPTPSGDKAAPDARKQRIGFRALSSVSALLMLVIVLMANYLGFRHYQRFDWTAQDLYTLSGKSLSVLRGLQQPVDIYLFMSRAEPNFADTEELLKRYQTASSRIRIHIVDPDREPAEFEVLAQRFGLTAGIVLGTGETMVDVAAVVAAGERKWSVKRDDLISYERDPTGGGDETLVNVRAEQALTGAVVQVTSGKPTRVCPTTGHGEWNLEPYGQRSLHALQEALRHDNIEWRAVETLGKIEIDPECDAVLVVGPTVAFNADEAALLAGYLREGGNLLLALDPVIERDGIKPSGLEEMARGLGVIIDRTLVIELDRERLLSPNVAEFLITDFGEHPTTKPLAGVGRIYLGLARSVRPVEGGAAEVLVRSSEQSFAETDVSQIRPGTEPVRDEHDLAGPLSLAVAVRAEGGAEPAEEKSSGRLIVVGDSDLFEGPLLGSPELTNAHLASAWIGWLTEREALIAVPPKKAAKGSVMFTQGDLGGIAFRVLVLLPLLVLIVGVAVWLNRRS